MDDVWDWKQYGATVSVSRQLVDDAREWGPYHRLVEEQVTAGIREMLLDITDGPRYGPPAPRPPEPEREFCDCCGQEIGDDWDD